MDGLAWYVADGIQQLDGLHGVCSEFPASLCPFPQFSDNACGKKHLVIIKSVNCRWGMQQDRTVDNEPLLHS